MTTLATTIGLLPGLITTLAVLSVVALVAGKVIDGRYGPTLAVLLVGIPAALGAGTIHGWLITTGTDIRWLFAGIFTLAFAGVAGFLTVAIYLSVLNNRPDDTNPIEIHEPADAHRIAA
ncbi:hypothetical protein ABN028_09505 [Actinopolymorpha sp. B17G11]|uniref:hypothetical protein n=1 Tax=Actinopolymorpha sp. B17G11 TaxID=3160861 RepID=UPI0032E4B50B